MMTANTQKFAGLRQLISNGLMHGNRPGFAGVNNSAKFARPFAPLLGSQRSELAFAQTTGAPENGPTALKAQALEGKNRQPFDELVVTRGQNSEIFSPFISSNIEISPLTKTVLPMQLSGETTFDTTGTIESKSDQRNWAAVGSGLKESGIQIESMPFLKRMNAKSDLLGRQSDLQMAKTDPISSASSISSAASLGSVIDADSFEQVMAGKPTEMTTLALGKEIRNLSYFKPGERPDFEAKKKNKDSTASTSPAATANSLGADSSFAVPTKVRPADVSMLPTGNAVTSLANPTPSRQTDARLGRTGRRDSAINVASVAASDSERVTNSFEKANAVRPPANPSEMKGNTAKSASNPTSTNQVEWQELRSGGNDSTRNVVAATRMETASAAQFPVKTEAAETTPLPKVRPDAPVRELLHSTLDMQTAPFAEHVGRPSLKTSTSPTAMANASSTSASSKRVKSTKELDSRLSTISEHVKNPIHQAATTEKKGGATGPRVEVVAVNADPGSIDRPDEALKSCRPSTDANSPTARTDSIVASLAQPNLTPVNELSQSKKANVVLPAVGAATNRVAENPKLRAIHATATVTVDSKSTALHGVEKSAAKDVQSANPRIENSEGFNLNNRKPAAEGNIIVENFISRRSPSINDAQKSHIAFAVQSKEVEIPVQPSSSPANDFSQSKKANVVLPVADTMTNRMADNPKLRAIRATATVTVDSKSTASHGVEKSAANEVQSANQRMKNSEGFDLNYRKLVADGNIIVENFVSRRPPTTNNVQKGHLAFMVQNREAETPARPSIGAQENEVHLSAPSRAWKLVTGKTPATDWVTMEQSFKKGVQDLRPQRPSETRAVERPGKAKSENLVQLFAPTFGKTRPDFSTNRKTAQLTEAVGKETISHSPEKPVASGRPFTMKAQEDLSQRLPSLPAPIAAANTELSGKESAMRVVVSANADASSSEIAKNKSNRPFVEKTLPESSSKQPTKTGHSEEKSLATAEKPSGSRVSENSITRNEKNHQSFQVIESVKDIKDGRMSASVEVYRNNLLVGVLDTPYPFENRFVEQPLAVRLAPSTLTTLSAWISANTRQFSQNEDNLIIRAESEELGVLRIHLLHRDDGADVAIRVQSEESKSMLENSLLELKQQLDKGETPITDLRVFVDDRSHRQYLAQHNLLGKRWREARKKRQDENVEAMVRSQSYRPQTILERSWSSYEVVG